VVWPTRGEFSIWETISVYDSDGKILYDLDYQDNHPDAGNPHVHWWDWGNGSGTPVRGKHEAVPSGWGADETTEDGLPVLTPWGKPLPSYNRIPGGLRVPGVNPVLAPITGPIVEPVPVLVPVFP
jgi:hypothetical protein